MNANELKSLLEGLRERFEGREALNDERLREIKKDVEEIKSRLSDLEKKSSDADKRLAVLEQGSGNLWRLVPILISAAMGVVAILSLFVAFMTFMKK
jgi:DNA repair exonuclease SbcCD ATPase subunit